MMELKLHYKFEQSNEKVCRLQIMAVHHFSLVLDKKTKLTL